MFRKWVRPETATIKNISELLILEQFLRMVNPEMEVLIWEHDLETAEEAAYLAEVFQSARRGRRGFAASQNSYLGRKSKSYGDEGGSGPR